MKSSCIQRSKTEPGTFFRFPAGIFKILRIPEESYTLLYFTKKKSCSKTGKFNLALDDLLSNDLASTGSDLCWRGYSHRTGGLNSAKEKWKRHHRNQSWWWEPDRPPMQVDYDMETFPTSVTRHGGSSSNEDGAPPRRDSSGTSSGISIAASPRANHQSQSSWRAATSTSKRTASFNGVWA